MKIIKLFIWSILFSLLAITLGCGGGGDSTSEEKASETTKTAAVPAGTATVSGTINFTGEAPRMRRVKHDAECAAFHTEPVFSQNVVVNDNNTLKYVFVYVKKVSAAHMIHHPNLRSSIKRVAVMTPMFLAYKPAKL